MSIKKNKKLIFSINTFSDDANKNNDTFFQITLYEFLVKKFLNIVFISKL